MSPTANNGPQAEAAEAILKRIKHLAPKADAAELKKLADAYTSVAVEQDGFDPRAIFGQGFNPFARFTDCDAD